MDTVDMLQAFGLTRQEAKLYIALHGRGAATGYEMARLTGISRSNAYAGLASLADKGAAAVIDGTPQRFLAVAAGEFCQGRIRRLEELRAHLEAHLVLVDEEDSHYLTIRGSRNIADKMHAVIAATRHRIYIAMPVHALRPFRQALEELAARGRKVVVVTTGQFAVAGAGAGVFQARHLPSGFRLIADSAAAMTGELDGGDDCTCLFSMKRNLAELIKESIRNDIRVIELSETKSASPTTAKEEKER